MQRPAIATHIRSINLPSIFMFSHPFRVVLSNHLAFIPGLPVFYLPAAQKIAFLNIWVNAGFWNSSGWWPIKM
jgi:hypothetical protein